MHEPKVIAAILQSRDALQLVEEWIDEADYTAKGWVILTAARDYYQRDKAAHKVDREILLARIERNLPNAKALDGFQQILDKLPTDIGAKNVAQEMLALKREASEERLENLLAKRSGAKLPDKIAALEEYNALLQASDLENSRDIRAYEQSVGGLFNIVLSTDNRIKIAPPELNDRLGGGALPGHCIVIFGRVEMGKSLMALNMAAGIVAQGKSVLWVENEDTLADTKRRYTQRILRRPLSWIQAHTEEAVAKYEARKGDLFTLTEDPETVKDIEAAVAQFEPDVVIINQMRNMVGGEGVTDKLDQLAHKLRRVGKKRDRLMILVTAAREGDVRQDGTISPKPVLESGDVYSSRTGIPAVADVLIGVGGSASLKEQCMMCLSISKNKLVDGNHTADGKYPALGHFYVHVDPETGFIQSEERSK